MCMVMTVKVDSGMKSVPHHVATAEINKNHLWEIVRDVFRYVVMVVREYIV